MEYASSDIRFDVPLAEACFDDRQDFCSGVPPGSARVIRCLQDKCARSLFPFAVPVNFARFATKIIFIGQRQQIVWESLSSFTFQTLTLSSMPLPSNHCNHGTNDK